MFVFLCAGGRLFLQLHTNEQAVVIREQAAECVESAVAGSRRHFVENSHQLVCIVEQADGIAVHNHLGLCGGHIVEVGHGDGLVGSVECVVAAEGVFTKLGGVCTIAVESVAATSGFDAYFAEICGKFAFHL